MTTELKTLSEKIITGIVDENIEINEISKLILSKDVSEKIKKVKESLENEIDTAQEDYANLDWVSKVQAIRIIDKIFFEEIGKELLK